MTERRAEEAIRELIKDWPGVTHPRVTAHVLARAAIEALELTEEEQPFYSHPEPFSTGYKKRLVGPWVEEFEDD